MPVFANKSKYQSNAPGITVIKQENELFANAVDYRNYLLIIMSARYEDVVANELNNMTKKTAVQMKNWTFNGKDPVSIAAFPQDFKAARNVYIIHKGRRCGY